MSYNTYRQLIVAVVSKVPPSQRPARTTEALSKWLSTWEFYGQLSPIVRNLESDWTVEQVIVMNPVGSELEALPLDVALKFICVCRLFELLTRPIPT